MTNAPKSVVRVLLLREVATGPEAAAFVAERWTREGSSLAVVKVLRDQIPAPRIMPLHQNSLQLGLLRHRHIVSVDQVVLIDGHFGLISPYIDGMDLLDWTGVLRENDVPMPPRVVCEVLRGIAVALDAAQNRTPWGEEDRLGLCHGDLKPGNVMIDRDGELKVLDFCTGASALAGEVGTVRSAQTYVAPERRDNSSPTPEADVYALGMMGIELLGERWLHTIPQVAEDHDLHLGQLVKRFDFAMRSEADEQTLRSLLLRMVSFPPTMRPRAAVVAQTLRRLVDRAPGPSLESFAHEHGLPYLRNAPENPDTGLMIQVSPVSVDLALLDGPEPDADTNTMGPGDFGRLLDNDVGNPAFLVDTGSWDRDSASLADKIADETEQAIEAARQARMLDRALEFDTSIFDPADDEPTDTNAPDGLADMLDDLNEVQDVEAEVVYEPPEARRRPTYSRPMMVLAAFLMLIGAAIAVSAVLIGLLVGVYVTVNY